MTSLILAAGMSRRMGENKLLLLWRGKTIIEHTIALALRNSGRVVVVIGHEEGKIRPIIEKYPVEIRLNPDYEKGHRTSQMVASLGIDDDIAWLNGDMPLINDEIWMKGKKLLEEGKASRPVFNGELGSPVFTPSYMTKGLRESPEPFKVYLKKNGIVLFDGTKESVFDVDTKERYRELLQY